MSSLPPHARKRLGQHFLVDPNVLRKIVSLAEIQPTDSVCEIGPGRGALTEGLCHAAKQVLALEVDSRMVEFLRAKMIKHVNLDIRLQDALKYPFDDLPPSTVVVANLPYNISTPLLFRMLESHQQISRMVLTVQLEVAQRLTAQPNTKDYGVLSVMAQYASDVKFGFKITKKCFRPVPDVDSGVVRLDLFPRSSERVEEFINFQRVVRAAFGHRRKTLLNAFKGAGWEESLLQRVQQETGIDFRRRAETLSLSEFQRIVQSFFP